MISIKIQTVLQILAENFSEQKISYALMGALALGIYGFPRYTADIDLLGEAASWPRLLAVMEKLGYHCSSKTGLFAQFESELGVLGYVDFMLTSTDEGHNILRNSVIVPDAVVGKHPVIQPTDFIVLKLMAIANNPERAMKDENDIASLMTLYQNNMISRDFELLNKQRIHEFSKKFGQTTLAERYLRKLIEPGHEK